MNAYQELQAALLDGEIVESIRFGEWGAGYYSSTEGVAFYCRDMEPDPPLVPHDIKGRLMCEAEAAQYMAGWSFDNDHEHGAACYETCVWTNRRIAFVCVSEGSTWLKWVPRHPEEAG